ncbi:MAG: SCO family protein [Pseudomonadota bacterium]|nr:SCO family protein [Pseudomonadota bacterium]
MLVALLLACAPELVVPPVDPAAPTVEVTAPSAPATAPSAPPEDRVPAMPAGASLYALDLPLLTHTGAAARLDVQRGHPVLLSMFYTTCPMACPLLIADLQGLEAALSPEARAELRIVLVSLDPAHDDPAALGGVVEKHNLDARWTLGAVPEDSVREVAAALGVRYRPLPGGGFAHTAALTLIDADGRVVARSEGEEGRAALVAAIGDLAGRQPGVTGGR